ncbi:hypothetical protein [Candidatus Mycoplasma haematobovis]|nr:hypothetical protein [Candidatus Mycoplasma haematobovis]
MATTMKYTSLPTAVKLRVAIHPDVTKEWCGYNPNNYTIPVFLKGIFRDVYMGTVTNLKASITEPWLKEFIEEDPEAFLGDAFRHIEVGEIFPEEYTDIDRPDESLAPVSGHHLNIITETDKTIEKWHIRISHNRDTYASYFKDYSSFKEFVDLLKGHMTKGIKKALGLIVKAVMTSDPSQVVFDDKDFARIFGRTRDNPKSAVPAGPAEGTIESSTLGTKYNKMMQKLIQKYYGKAALIWKNIQWYNPYYFSFDDYYEEMSRDTIFEQANVGKDKSKRQMQQLYSDAHSSSEALRGDNQKTYKVHHLHRNDALFALFDAINKALIILTNEESPEFWLGNDTASRVQQIKAEAERARAEMAVASEVDGQVIGPDGAQPDKAYTTSASSDDAFEVTANKDSLVLLLNPEDYADLKTGIARRGQMDVRAVNLDMLGITVYPMRSMKPGFARLIDKKAFKIRSYFQMTDIQSPMEKLTWRYKMFYQFAITMFKNFAGCLFIPSPHFTASSNFYDKYGIIGQEVEKKQ